MSIAEPIIYSTTQYQVTYTHHGCVARYYQHLVGRKVNPGLYTQAIPGLREFISVFETSDFGTLFGLHNERLNAQATLNQAGQKIEQISC